MVIRRVSGTSFINTSCCACGQMFSQPPALAVLYTGDPVPERIGELCPGCVSTASDKLPEQMRAQAAALRKRADQLEQLARQALAAPLNRAA